MRTKPVPITIGDARWLTKAQAMAWVGVKTEEVFKKSWQPYLNIYGNGGRCGVFDKRQIDALMERKIQIKGNDYE